MWREILSSMLSFEQMMNRVDQLATLSVLHPIVGDKVDTRFTDEFYELFSKKWEYSFDKFKINFDTRLQVTSAATLSILHPELSQDDLYELSHVCCFIWFKFYKVTSKKYEEFLTKRRE